MKRSILLSTLLCAGLLAASLPASGQAVFKNLTQPEFDFDDFKPRFDDVVERPDTRFDLAVLRDQRNRARYSDANAQYNLAALEHLRGNYAVAVRWYRAAALMNHGLAAHNLGTLYYNGWGIEKDIVAAERWFQVAAREHVPAAQYQLGLMKYRAENGSADPAEEADWYEKAALAGYPEAQYNLGVLYSRGEGRPQSDEQALAWLLLAQRTGVESNEALARIDRYQKRLDAGTQRRAEVLSEQLGIRVKPSEFL